MSRDRALRWLGSTWFLGALIGLVTWRAAPLGPASGYDGSFQTALSWAASRGMDWGSEFIYTYGPLGFAEYSLVTFGTATSLFAAAYLLAANLGLGITLLWAARRTLPLALALVLASVVAASVTDVLPAVAFVIAGVALVDGKGTSRTVLAATGPPLAAIALLVKINEGILAATLIAIALVTLEWGEPRRLLRSAGIFAVVFVAGWLAAGQSLGNLDDYVQGAAEIASGYSVGQVADSPAVSWDGWAAAVMVLAALGATVALSARLPAARRAALIAIVGVLCVISVKHGFTRHSEVHLSSFIQAMLLPWLVLPFSERERAVPLAACAAIVLLAIPILGSHINGSRWDLPQRLSEVDQLASYVDPDKQEAVEANSRRQIIEIYHLPPRQLAQLGGRSVHIVPQDMSLLWAHDLDWQPLPVFDPFTSYHPSQDRRNADALEAEDGPERILRYRSPTTEGMPNNANAAVDDRYLPWNIPQTSLAIYCNYRPLSTSPTFQVLARAPDRCGQPRTVETVTAAYGEPVRVPRDPPDGVLLAKVEGLGATPLETLKRLAFRGDTRSITLDGGSTYGVLAAMAPSGLVVRIPKQLDFPSPFRLAPNAKTLRFEEHSRLNGGSAEIEVEFVVVPVDSPR